MEAIQSVGGQAIVTADHGNADKMMEADGSPFTAHTTNPVPFIVVKEGDFKLAEGGILADVAPTLLDMMGIESPPRWKARALSSSRKTVKGAGLFFAIGLDNLALQ